MALQKQVVRMSAEGGLDTKTDSKNVLPTNYLELENIRFTKTGSFTKRPGYEDYTKSILASTDLISSGKALTTFKDELLRYSDTNLYSYIESEDKWADKGDTKFALATEYSVLSNGERNLNPSHDTISNLTCYAYRRDDIVTSGVNYRIIDNTTGSVLFTGEVQSSADNPYVFGILGRFYIVYQVGAEVRFKTINFSTPHLLSTATVALTGATYYVANKIGNRVYVVKAAATGLSVVFITADSVVNGPFTVADANAFQVLSVSGEQGTSVRLVYGNPGGGRLVTVLYSADMNYAIHPPLDLSPNVAVNTIGAVQSPTDVNRSHVYISICSPPFYVAQYIVTSAGTFDSFLPIIQQAALQSLPQAFEGKVYFAVVRDTSFLEAGPVYAPFRTYFLASEDGELLTKFSEDVSAVRKPLPNLPNLNVEGTKLAFSGIEAAEIQANVFTNDAAVPTTIKKYEADFNQLNNYFDAPLGDNIHIAGGVLRMYDGDRVVEHGFLQIPDAPVFVSETGVGATLTDGSYQYLTVFKWIDKWGQVHRSAPSLPLTYVVTGGPKKPTIRVFTLGFTTKTNVEIETYRTEADGTIFYKRATNFGDRIENDPTVESLTFSDTLTDADLITNEVLYTTGGTLDNMAASSSKAIATYKSRVILLLSDGYTLQYSKQRQPKSPVEFAAELKLDIDAFGGPGTAIATMDDHVIIFKENSIYTFSGEGPNDLGEQNDFRTPSLITTDAGCIDANSVVNTPNGLMFKSSKGIYMLGRNFQAEYIGAPVEGYNRERITSSTLLTQTNEVRFSTETERSLIYDYFHKKWTTDTNINAVDGVMFRDVYHYLRANGDLMAETSSQFSDNGSYIKMKLSSAWIQMAGIQGFERFYKMLILGGYKSPHLLKVKFAYDFDPSWKQEATIDAGNVLGTENFGEDGNFGVGTPFGGEYPLYQFRIFPKIQKCESFRFQIEDFRTTGTGEGLSLSNFAAEIGLKPPAYKKADSKSFAAS